MTKNRNLVKQLLLKHAVKHSTPRTQTADSPSSAPDPGSQTQSRKITEQQVIQERNSRDPSSSMRTQTEINNKVTWPPQTRQRKDTPWAEGTDNSHPLGGGVWKEVLPVQLNTCS